MNKKNIRVLWLTLMLSVFIIPHISNVLHFVVIKHDFGRRTKVLEYVNSNSIHYCDQYLFKISPLLEFDSIQWEVIVELAYHCVDDFYLLSKYSFDTFYYYLRGPPEVLFLTHI
ncbi:MULTISPECIES: hypothetical protein [Myroides]|uniref:Uncharacterized protein n=1 Tax=Myroides albus TaxID=2562892 RepID=A0A6I3LLB8_9FLAO|nr:MULTISPECIES: hypothetical protein [Myroides]MTG96775.1 hypothetical protein [Myroides albus]MVX36177.1 hypothetical protein [Myroides sp. LoEW2-1]UVD80813.1 hypothetical protein NWE55_06110 [Myroides albus]